MNYNQLGNTGLLVSELCFGTMTFGGGGDGPWGEIGKVQQSEANQLIKAAIDGGINFIDTANVYSSGQAEQMLGQSLKDNGIRREDIVIATKVRGQMGDGPNNGGLSRYHILTSLDQSLQRLQMDHVDLYYVHGEDRWTPVEEVVQTLHDVVQSGKVRYVGVCNWRAYKVAQALAVADRHGWKRFSAVQYFYSAACRDVESEIIPLAQEQHLGVMPWSPLAGGFLSGKYNRTTAEAGNSRRDTFDFPPIDKEKAYDIVAVMQTIADAHQVSVPEVALAWVRLQPGVTSTIIGSKRTDQLSANIASVNLALTGEELRAISEVSQRPVLYPEWMVGFQTGGRK